MSRAKKNPVTDLPVMEESQPLSESSQNNVIAIGTNTHLQPDKPAIESSGRDWTDIDNILSNVVNFT